METDRNVVRRLYARDYAGDGTSDRTVELTRKENLPGTPGRRIDRGTFTCGVIT